MQKQHNLICAAVRTGRIEDLKRMAAKEAASKQKTTIVEKEIKLLIEINLSIKEKSPGENVKTNEAETLTRTTYQEKVKSFDRPQIEKTTDGSVKSLSVAKDEFISESLDELIWDVPISIVEETIVEAVQIFDEELIFLSDEDVEIITDYIGGELVADTKLKVRLLTEEKFKSGDQKTLRILVNRGNAAQGLSGVQVIIKILGSAFSPLIFHAKTDASGIATVYLQLPHFKTGHAAILIKAMSEGEEADLRRAVTYE